MDYVSLKLLDEINCLKKKVRRRNISIILILLACVFIAIGAFRYF